VSRNVPEMDRSWDTIIWQLNLAPDVDLRNDLKHDINSKRVEQTT